MRVLVVGSGAREHALAWKLSQSPQASKLFVAPGNAGTAAVATNLPIQADDVTPLLNAAKQHHVDVTVVGPEVPLAAGIVDAFQQKGLAIFGPTRSAARIESSKAYARELMSKHHIPSPRFWVFDSYEKATEFINRHDSPVVVKADGLAAGKGAIVCRTRQGALDALKLCMVDRAFGRSGDTVVLEELLVGTEVSVFSFVDGETVSWPVAACDYKRAYDGDRGPNTGGMGGYSLPAFWTQELAERVYREIMVPTVQALAEAGSPFVGILYAGLMLTIEGPKVLEFNCRFGDPEAQVLLPRLKTDLVDIVEACLQHSLSSLNIEWSEEATVGVVLASGGYPGSYEKGVAIKGLDSLHKDVLSFHAGTRLVTKDGQQQVVTDGGRVLTIVAKGKTLEEARKKAYDNVVRVHFEGMHYRKDIAFFPNTGRLGSVQKTDTVRKG